jgi:hypothetical protein
LSEWLPVTLEINDESASTVCRCLLRWAVKGESLCALTDCLSVLFLLFLSRMSSSLFALSLLLCFSASPLSLTRAAQDESLAPSVGITLRPADRHDVGTIVALIKGLAVYEKEPLENVIITEGSATRRSCFFSSFFLPFLLSTKSWSPEGARHRPPCAQPMYHMFGLFYAPFFFSFFFFLRP